MTGEPADHPGLRFPPPLLYAAAGAAGQALERARPLPLGAPPLLRRRLGGGLVVAGAALASSAVLSFLAERTSPIPVHPARALVVRGPYRYTRNPMYLGMLGATAGTGVLRDNGWTLLLLAPVTAVAERAFIRPEERYLERRFGRAYRDYCARVRRWV